MMDALEIFIVGRFRLGAKFQLRISRYDLVPIIMNYTTNALKFRSFYYSTYSHYKDRIPVRAQSVVHKSLRDGRGSLNK
jgi:hypothetical protein